MQERKLEKIISNLLQEKNNFGAFTRRKKYFDRGMYEKNLKFMLMPEKKYFIFKYKNLPPPTDYQIVAT